MRTFLMVETEDGAYLLACFVGVEFGNSGSRDVTKKSISSKYHPHLFYGGKSVARMGEVKVKRTHSYLYCI
jgi:hypothetical protein